MSETSIDRRLLRGFIRFDLIAAVGAVAVCVVGQFVIVNEPMFWIVPGAISVLVVLLAAATRQLTADRVAVTIGLVALGNWIVSLVVPIALPFMWPVLALTAIVPVVLAAPYLTPRQSWLMIAAGSLVTGLVAVIGLLGDDGGVIDDVDDTYELLLVVVSLAAVSVPVGLVVSQANRLQRESLDHANRLNDDLRGSQQQLADSRRRVVNAADTERIRIERDLHDGAQQRLVALGVHLRLLQSRTVGDAAPDDLHRYVSMLVDELDLAIDELRELAHGIYPPLLEARGLVEALEAVGRRSALPLTIDADEVERLDPSTESALYFVALEAIANASKHSQASSISIELRSIPEADDGMKRVAMTVSDDGIGFDPAMAPTSRGMLNMSDRIASVDGAFEVRSTPGTGTQIAATVTG